MIGIKASLYGLKFNKVGWLKAAERQAEILVRKAARAYIRELYINIPVWSGLTRGSIKFAQGSGGSLAAYLNVAIPIDPLPKRTRRDKNPEAGEHFGRYSFTNGNGRHIYRFYYRSDVPYYEFHDFNPRPAHVRQQITAPWRSQDKAAAAYLEVIVKGAKELRNIKKFIGKVNVFTTAGTVSSTLS